MGEKKQTMDDLPEKSLGVLKSLSHSGFVRTQDLGPGRDSISTALTNRGYATKRIGVFSANGALLPPGTEKGPDMTTSQILEITEAGRIRASNP